MNTQIDDEILMAYADGELDATQAAQIQLAMQTDASIAARVAQHRALRVQLQTGCTDVLSEQVPQRLLNTLLAPAAPAVKVIKLAQARQLKSAPPTRRWSSREWGAMAASLVAGIVVGMYALDFNSAQLVSEQGGTLIAQGKLDSALTTQLASHSEAASAIQIGISFRNHNGEYCRSFALTEGDSLAGLACRAQDRWRVQLLTEANDDASEFRQAGSTTPAAVLALVDQQIEGEPLDADAEATAQKSGWK
jgi:hypothetical protein